ncbi:MAG TPA: hypothetical protein VK709_16390 [Candidatus Saccharimonadales bacterium]|nr:hypothetical protein [Candidatus Saccharimonadales bacterium]
MNFGFNSNVRVGESLFHVQTEDRGPSHPFLDTVIYLSGRVIYKRSTSYEEFAAGVDDKILAEKLHERLAQQHREVIAQLEAGTITVPGKPAPVVKNEEDETGLTLALLNPKNWFTAGNVRLEISLQEKLSRQKIADAEIQVFLEHEKRRIGCADARTDSQGLATLNFPMPANVADGSSLVVRATDGILYGELRFHLKSKPQDKKPVSVA